jgi:hypothetical protein
VRRIKLLDEERGRKQNVRETSGSRQSASVALALCFRAMPFSAAGRTAWRRNQSRPAHMYL